MGINPVTNPSGGTFTGTGSVSGGSQGTGTGAIVNAEIADLLRRLESISSSLDSGGVSTVSANGEETGPTLDSPKIAPNIALGFIISTLNSMRNKLSEAIQASIFGDIDVLQALFKQYLLIGDPGALTRAILEGTSSDKTPEEIEEFLERLKAGTATQNQIDMSTLFNTFQSWLKTLDTKDRVIVADSLVMILRLLPDTDTPSISQDFSDSSAGGARTLSLKAATQTQTGADYFRELIRSLFDEFMHYEILTAAARSGPFGVKSASGEEEESGEDRRLDRLQEALTILIANASVLSNKAALSLLKDANGVALQNPQVIELAKATAVLATFLSLVRPESTDTALNEFAEILGIDLSKLSPEGIDQVSTYLAQFLQQALITTGLTAFEQAYREFLSQKQPPEEVEAQILRLRTRVSDLGKALNGEPVTAETLAETLTAFQAVIEGNVNHQEALRVVISERFQQTLEGEGVKGNKAAEVAHHLSKQVIDLFVQKGPVTAVDIQDIVATQEGLTVEQQGKLTHQLLALAAGVTTQQDVQTALIRGGAVTAASRFGAQLSQVFYGFSVDLLDGKVTKASESGEAPFVAQIAPPIGPAGSFNRSRDVNVDMGTFLLKLMEPASVMLQLASPIMYGGPQSSIAGDRNIGPKNVAL